MAMPSNIHELRSLKATPVRGCKDSEVVVPASFIAPQKFDDQLDGYFSDSVYDEDEICTTGTEDNHSTKSTATSGGTKSTTASGSRCPDTTDSRTDQERHLTEQNERLLRENMLLRQQCEEIRNASQTCTLGFNSDLQSTYSQSHSLTVNSESDVPAYGSAAQVPPNLMGCPPGMLCVPNHANGSIPHQNMAYGSGFVWVAMACPMQMTSMPPGDFTSGAGGSRKSMNFRNQEAFSNPMPEAKHKTCNTFVGQTSDACEISAGVQSSDCTDEENLSSPDLSCGGNSEENTTVMLRNLPNNYTRAMMLDLIDGEGFVGQYDFFYLPIDFTTKACLGYAFVNLVNHEAANRFKSYFSDFSDWIIPSRKHCIVNWSGPHQGLQAHIERYRNSPVMHQSVPDEYKPIILQQGVRMCFPSATRKIRAPRVRRFM